MKKELILGICIVAGSIVAASIVAAPVAAVSDSGADIPEDWYDETVDLLDFNVPSIVEWKGGFNKINQQLDKPVKTPDEVMGIVKENIYTDISGKRDIHTIKITPTDFAAWFAVASEEELIVSPYLMYLNTDLDPEPEELCAMMNIRGTLIHTGTNLDPIRNHVIGVSHYKDYLKKTPVKYTTQDGTEISWDDDMAYPDYLANPFDVPENPETYTNLQKLVYWKNPEEVKTTNKVIHWKNAVGKTPTELGLDKYDKPTSAEREAYEAELREEQIERYIQMGASKESAEDMVEHFEISKELEEKQIHEEHKAMAEEDKTPGFVGTLGLGAIGMAAYLGRKYKNKGGMVKNGSREVRDEKF